MNNNIMKKNIDFIFFSIYLIYGTVLAKDPVRLQIVQTISTYPPGNAISGLLGQSFTNSIYCLASDLPSSNPSSVSYFFKPTFGVSWEYHSAISQFILENTELKRNKSWIPQSLGFIIPLKKISVGFGFYRKYSATLSLKNIPLTSILEPEGTGDTFDAKTMTDICTGSISISKIFANPIKISHKVSIRFQLNLDHLNTKSSIWHASAESEDLNMNWKFGLIYDTQKYGKFSLVYDKGASFLGESEVKGLITAEPDSVNNRVTTDLSNRFTAEFPSRIFTGFLYDNLSWFSIFANINLVLWESVDRNLKNQIDISGSLSIKKNDEI